MTKLNTSMLPQRPEDWPRAFEERLNAGDLDGVMNLYEPEAQFASRTGEMLTGRDRIRDPVHALILSKAKLRSHVAKVFMVGEIAQLYTNFEGTALDVSGKTIELRQKAIEVLRRQPGGGWKLIMGDPNGRG